MGEIKYDCPLALAINLQLRKDYSYQGCALTTTHKNLDVPLGKQCFILLCM